MTALNQELKQQLDSTVEKFLAERYAFDTRQSLVASELGYSAENWQSFAELGWLGIPFAEQHGGIGGEIADTLDMMRLFGKHLVVEPVVSTVGLVGTAIAQGNNQTMQAELLPRLISGELVAALALEEPASRGNPGFVGLSALPVDGGYRLQGDKVCVLNAPQSDYLLVSARTAGEQTDILGISLFLLERNQPGVTLAPYLTVDGHRAANLQV